MSVGGPEVCGPECVGLEVLDHPAALPAEVDHLNLQSYLLSWGEMGDEVRLLCLV